MRILFFIFTSFILFSCGNTKWETKSFEGFSIEVPDYLTASTRLNDAADAQFENGVREVYLVVLKETKEEAAGFTFDSYCEVVKENFKKGADAEIINENHVKVNSLSSFQFDSFARVEGYEVFYVAGIFESENNFYQVISWTLKGRKDTYEADLRRIVNSLKEI